LEEALIFLGFPEEPALFCCACGVK